MKTSIDCCASPTKCSGSFEITLRDDAKSAGGGEALRKSSQKTVVEVEVTCDITDDKFVIPAGLSGAAIALNAIGIIIAMVMFGLIMSKKNHMVIRAASPRFLGVIIFGCILGYAANLLAAFEMTTAFCCAQLWMGDVAFSLVFGSLFAKNFRLAKLFNNKKLKKKKISDMDLAKWMVPIVGIQVVILGVWSIVGVPEARRGLSPTRNYQTYIACGAFPVAHHTAFRAIDIVFKFLLLIWGLYVASRTSQIKDKRFNESIYVAYTMYTIFFAAIIILPLLYAIELAPEAQIAFQCFGIFLVTTACLLILFIPKVMLAQGEDKGFNPTTSATVSGQTSGGTATVDVKAAGSP
jgi:gamma-aminobutyric acid type B receptor